MRPRTLEKAIEMEENRERQRSQEKGCKKLDKDGGYWRKWEKAGPE